MRVKPLWLNKKVNLKECAKAESLLKELRLHTVCQSALCPNVGECFSQGNATFLILGDICTRDCSFCNLHKGDPKPVDEDEPLRIVEAVSRLKLTHVVITSVTRDDLADGGAGHFARTVKELRKKCSKITIETLIPDFLGDGESIRALIDSRPDIIAHNVETVPRLYLQVRQAASYRRSLHVLKIIKEMDSSIYTKSGLMLGLGENHKEILRVMLDLMQTGCDYLSLGQYLAPTQAHYAVQSYIKPKRFEQYRKIALGFGFQFVASAPYVRSSYLAAEYMNAVA